MCAQKKFVMYRNVGVQRKVVLIEGNGCIVFCEYKKKRKEKNKKEKERKTSKVSMLWLGSINHS